MPTSVLDHLCRGTFVWLRPDPQEIRRIFGKPEDLLPSPQLIFLEDETATPLVGFPILLSRSDQRLRELVRAYLDDEEEAQVAYHNRSAFDSKRLAARWEAYRQLLSQIVENATVSSLGYDYHSVFWLHHSLEVARYLQDTPKRLRRRDLAVGRDHGDDIKYKIFFKWIDRVTNLTSDVASELADEMGEDEDTLFPQLLARMRDNVLIFTEDYIGPDLKELASYFQGCLKDDLRNLRQRMEALGQWHDHLLPGEPLLRSAVEDLLALDSDGDPRRLLRRSGYVTFLSKHPAYDPERFPTPDQVKTWEGLLGKLKEFEILHALRKMVVPLERNPETQELVSRDRSINTTWVGGPPVLRVSRVTRPLDFGAPWVVDPLVHRFGLVYDITDFSAILSMLGRAERSALEDAFRMTAQFQRKIDRLASSLNLRLEKYLGDGAFYSGRQSLRMLALAVGVQRLYPQFVERGFPFDRGLRIALNLGEYRLLALANDDRSAEPRYEYFGHGLVELSRLTTGKKTQEIESFKTYLVSQGYSEQTVNKFFSPMLRRNADLVSKIDEQRPFFAYINQTSTLINEGMVATEPFIERLGSFAEMFYVRAHGRGFIAVPIEEGGQKLMVGFRKLGIGKFKGLEPLPIYEVVDCDSWESRDLKEIPPQKLVGALERLFTRTMAAQQQARQSG
ncbi:MAG: hypothetical protein AAGN66_17000 [Acidobacteriota bacterium]